MTLNDSILLKHLSDSSAELSLFNAMDDYVRVVDSQRKVRFANDALKRFNQVEADGEEVFPIATVADAFTDKTVTTTELCVAGHVFALKSSPIFEDGEVSAVIQVFRDTTISNNITLQLLRNNQKMHEELALAQSIQTKMLPRLTGYGPLIFDFTYQPTEELSGDFFDFVPLGQGRLGFYISDVVGHGVSASILTMFIRQTMRNILEVDKIREPATVLGVLRQHFREIRMDDSQYFSLFYALFDTVEHTLAYANAGHNCLPLVELNGTVEELAASGRLMTARQDAYTYKQYTRDLREGERYLFFTDGAVETQNAAGEEYGEENLKRLLRTTKGSALPYIIDDLRQYTVQSLKDDVALVYIENRRKMS